MARYDDLNQLLNDYMFDLSKKAIKIAKANTPVDKGNLKKSVRKENDKRSYEIVWGGTKETTLKSKKHGKITYAYFVDEGTKKIAPRNFSGKTLKDISKTL